MKYRRLLIYLFPFVVCAVSAIHHDYKSVDYMFFLESTNIYELIENAFYIAFQVPDQSVMSPTCIQYISWLVTYSIMFEFGIIAIKLVTFLPKLMDRFIDRILGGEYDKV